MDEQDSEPPAEMETALDRMGTIINRMLNLARQGQSISEREPVSLSSVANACWDIVEGQDATVTVEPDTSVLADRDRFRQLLENLFRNAIEHGGPDVDIRIGTLPDETGFYLADDGTGIPEDERQQVFESGFSTAEKGTGLGLTIVEEIADAHGWRVMVTESPNGGARFVFAEIESAE